MKYGSVAPFRKINRAGFLASLSVEILMEPEPHLTHIDCDCAVLYDAVVLRLTESGNSNLVFARLLCAPSSVISAR